MCIRDSLQIMRTQENTALSAFRRGLGITVFTEGWGLYAERLGREVGFFKDPYSDFGRLTYEIWRAVRLVVDSGVHALGWTRAQGIAYMAENTGFKSGPSIAETDRHITEAGQGLAYTFGLLKILELRAQAEARLGARFDLQAFHEDNIRKGTRHHGTQGGARGGGVPYPPHSGFLGGATDQVAPPGVGVAMEVGAGTFTHLTRRSGGQRETHGGFGAVKEEGPCGAVPRVGGGKRGFF